MFTPNSILWMHTKSLINSVHPSIQTHANSKVNEGWRIYVVAQNRGRCYYYHKVITIPLFACNRSKEYLSWYLAHELSHAEAAKLHGMHIPAHGQEFMTALKNICPAEFLHFETNYKPKNAFAAGISKSMHVNTGTVPDDF